MQMFAEYAHAPVPAHQIGQENMCRGVERASTHPHTQRQQEDTRNQKLYPVLWPESMITTLLVKSNR